jgi:hypothetical protein
MDSQILNEPSTHARFRAEAGSPLVQPNHTDIQSILLMLLESGDTDIHTRRRYGSGKTSKQPDLRLFRHVVDHGLKVSGLIELTQLTIGASTHLQNVAYV